MDLAVTNNVANINASAQSSPISAGGTSGDIDFSALLKDTIDAQVKEGAVTMSSGYKGDMSSGMVASGAGGIEQMILTAATTGEVSDVQMALLMLCMMMRDSENGEFSHILSMMGQMLGSQSDETTSTARSSILSSDFQPYILEEIDNILFSKYRGADAGGLNLPEQAWKAATPAITARSGERSPELLRDIIDQFNVTGAERYRPYKYGKDTYCNIFVWDVTSALGCEIPHYIDSATGEPRSYPDVKGAWEMGANATHDWLLNSGGSYGWRQVDARTAQEWANGGGAAVTAWKNPTGGSGHVQIVCPSESGGYDSANGVTVAQAGARNLSYANINTTYKKSQLEDVKYFINVNDAS